MMRVGILSAAHLHVEGYVENLRAASGVELVGIADDDLERGRQVAAASGLHLFDRYEDLLDQRLDAALVCSENARHRPLVELAAQAGVHVLCEKPLATTLADAEAVLSACRRGGVVLMVAFPMRFSAPLLEIKRILDAGDLGRIVGCTATNQGQNPGRHRPWFVNRALAGGGALVDHTVHLLDVLRWFSGSEVVEVYAQVNDIMPSRGDVESAGLVSLRFDDGLVATIDCSWSRPDSYPTWGGLALEVIGERGVVSADAFAQVFSVYAQRSPRVRWHYWGSDPNQAMIDEFVSAIREGRQPRVTGWDGYRAVEVVVGAYESSQRGQPVQIPPRHRHHV